MPSFEQLEIYFSSINASGPATSAQANWIAGAAEALQLAAELRKNMAELQNFWSGPAATEYNGAMNAIIEFAEGLAQDMTDMSTGLASMASMAASTQPQALAIINAARSNPYSRAAAIAPLTAMLQALGAAYRSNKSAHWREPSEPPQKLPKSGGEGDSMPTQVDPPKDVRPAPILGDLADIGQFLHLASSAYEAFNQDDFPSGVTGEFPGGSYPGDPGGISPGPGGSYPGGPGGGPAPGADHPDYQPLPEPDTELTESPVNLAGVSPTGLSAGSPAVSLAVGGGNAMGAPGGPMPMGMGMGAAGAAGTAARPAASSGGRAGGGGGMFGAPMGGARRNEEQSEDGVRTWLTEDELAWDADDAPGGVVGDGTSRN